MADRRKDSREHEENKVVIEFVTSMGDSIGVTEIYALTKDISVGGVRIVTDWFFPIDTFFKVNLALPKSKQVVQVEGQVRWIKSLDDSDDLFEVGVEFVHDLPETTMALINHILEIEKGIPSIVRRADSNA
ncbi:MAG: PilZ domain-containing protein [Candidatus Aminicenantaceae bacterium]